MAMITNFFQPLRQSNDRIAVRNEISLPTNDAMLPPTNDAFQPGIELCVYQGKFIKKREFQWLKWGKAINNNYPLKYPSVCKFCYGKQNSGTYGTVSNKVLKTRDLVSHEESMKHIDNVAAFNNSTTLKELLSVQLSAEVARYVL